MRDAEAIGELAPRHPLELGAKLIFTPTRTDAPEIPDQLATRAKELAFADALGDSPVEDRIRLGDARGVGCAARTGAKEKNRGGGNTPVSTTDIPKRKRDPAAGFWRRSGLCESSCWRRLIDQECRGRRMSRR